MENAGIDKLTKELMADSGLKLTSPNFDDSVMNQILLESKKQKDRNNLLFNILVFTGVEMVLLASLLVLILISPGLDYFTSSIKSLMFVFQKLGNLAIHYNYLILSFIVVGVLDWLMNKKEAIPVKF